MADQQRKEDVKPEVGKTVVKALQEITLPELTGLLTTRIMKAIEGNDSGTIQATIKAAISDLQMWYESQPVQGRQEIARSAKKSMEQFRLISEQLFHSMVQITLQDI